MFLLNRIIFEKAGGTTILAERLGDPLTSDLRPTISKTNRQTEREQLSSGTSRRYGGQMYQKNSMFFFINICCVAPVMNPKIQPKNRCFVLDLATLVASKSKRSKTVTDSK
jgi:hypothetical protein